MEKSIEEKIREASNDICVQIEEYIKLALKPRPKWMPNFLYKWLIKTFCVVERWNRPQIVILPKNDNDGIVDSQVVFWIDKAIKRLHRPSPEFCRKVGQLYGVDIFVDDTLPPDVWQLRCGRYIHRIIEEKMYDLKRFINGNEIENKEKNNVDKNQR